MKKLTEDDFQDVKEDLKHGRISPGTIRSGLGVFMVASLIIVGLSFYDVVARDTLIGWNNLSLLWRTIFKAEAVLLILQLMLIIFVKGRSNWSQIVLSVSYVIYTYKMALDPFIMVSMFAKNDGEYEIYAPMILMIIIVGLIIHLYLIRRCFHELKNEYVEKDDQVKSEKGNVVFVVMPIIFLLASVTGFIIRNQLLGDMENLFILGACTVVFIGLMIGTIEFVIGAYCVIRFPSFMVNPPTEKNRSMH